MAIFVVVKNAALLDYNISRAKIDKIMKLDGKLDEVLNLFADGDAFRVVAKKMDVCVRTLHTFLNKPENINQYRTILQESSDSYASKAEEVLMNAPGDKFELQRARDLAHHYRWMAAKRSPKRYGDKLDIDHTSGGEKIEPTKIIFGDGSGTKS